MGPDHLVRETKKGAALLFGSSSHKVQASVIPGAFASAGAAAAPAAETLPRQLLQRQECRGCNAAEEGATAAKAGVQWLQGRGMASSGRSAVAAGPRRRQQRLWLKQLYSMYSRKNSCTAPFSGHAFAVDEADETGTGPSLSS